MFEDNWGKMKLNVPGRHNSWQEVDLVVAPLTVTQQREHVMDFTYPYFNDADTFIYKKPGQEKNKWRRYLQPLKWQVTKCTSE